MAETEYKRLGCAVEGCALIAGAFKGSGNPRKYCSDHPGGRSNRETKECPGCLGFFMPAKIDQIFCTRTCGSRVRRGCRPKGTTDDYVCEFCGTGFAAEQKARFCTKLCKTKAWCKSNPEITKQRSREYALKSAAKNKPHLEQQKAKRTEAMVLQKAETAARRAANREQDLAKSRVESRERLEGLHRQDAKVVACEECGIQFCPLCGSRKNACCAPCYESRARAKASAAKAIRRAAEVANPVDPYKVFRAANWLCQICGTPTPKAKRGSYDDDAPELDHIHPLSKGGAHSYENTQCACRKCNGKKSDHIWQPKRLLTPTAHPVP